VEGQSLIVAGREVDPVRLVPVPVDRDTPRVPRTDQVVRAGLCIRRGLSPVELPAPADALVSAHRGQALAPALVLARPAPVWAVQVA
jgi:hypothetical protein